MKEPSINQIVFAVVPGQRANDGSEVQEWIVRKLGREYYYASSESWPENIHKITLETGREKCEWRGATVYLDITQYHEQKEVIALKQKIKTAFDGYGALRAQKLNLTTLREIWRLIKEATP